MAKYYYDLDPAETISEIAGNPVEEMTGYGLAEHDERFSITPSVNELDTIIWEGDTDQPSLTSGEVNYNGTSFAGARPPGR